MADADVPIADQLAAAQAQLAIAHNVMRKRYGDTPPDWELRRVRSMSAVVRTLELLQAALGPASTFTVIETARLAPPAPGAAR